MTSGIRGGANRPFCLPTVRVLSESAEPNYWKRKQLTVDGRMKLINSAVSLDDGRFAALAEVKKRINRNCVLPMDPPLARQHGFHLARP